MNRKTLVTVHLFLAAFFTPVVILMAISGGLYLSDVKGSVHTETVYQAPEPTIDTKASNLKAAVEALLLRAGVQDYSFEYVKVKGDTLYTRPTSRQHFAIKQSADSVTIDKISPDLVNALMELHKGHGPSAFKLFQKVFAVGLLIVMLSGLWLGLSARPLRNRTLLTSAAGTLAFLLVVLL